jgi:hypothetical protein
MNVCVFGKFRVGWKCALFLQEGFNIRFSHRIASTTETQRHREGPLETIAALLCVLVSLWFAYFFVMP